MEQDGASGPWRYYTKEIKLKLDYTDSSEWTKTYTDMAGRPYKTVFADESTPYPYSQSFYNNQGQLWKQRDPDNVETVFQYNAKGELEYTALDVDHNGTTSQPIDTSGNDRISRTVRSVIAATSVMPDLVQVDNYVWKDGNTTGTGTPVSRFQTSTDGLKTWTTVYRDTSTPVTSRSETVYGTSRTVTDYAPDNSCSVSVYSLGRLQSVTHKDSTSAPIGATTYTYDAHGRQKTVADVRNGTTTYNYNNADLISSVSTPTPGNGDPAQTTSSYYNMMLQLTNTVNPDSTRATNEYFLTGVLKKTYGSRTYPTEYTYDYAGRVATMKTWQNFAGNSGTAVTSWNYDPYRGRLANKRYADTTGPDYTYTPGGRLKTRTWARTDTSSQRIVTTYSYGFDDGVSGNDHGDLVSAVYTHDPQSTPSTTYTYDRLGRQSTLNWSGSTETLTYNDANQLLTDAYSGGTLSGLTVTSAFDTLLRRQTLSVNTSPSALTTTYGYDNASRLQTVNDGNNNSATYTYIANSPLVGQITFKQSTTTRMTTTKSYDHLNRLTSVANSPATLPVASFGYAYNLANQRTQQTEVDSSQWNYQYDALGQVKSAKKNWASSTPVAGEQFTYAYDDIGNRTSTSSGGDETGANLRTANYTPNSLNQYLQRNVPGYLDILGMASAGDTVTVNLQNTYRSGQYFRKELSVANSSAPVWQSVSVAATGMSPLTGSRFVAQTPEQFTYDLDGNLTQDGRWNYTWDAENRLIKVESLTSNSTASKRRVTWEYDCLGRRIRQTTYDGSSSSYVVTEDLKFVSDGMRHIAELNAANNALVRSYVWGLDLSGSTAGAGGVGGLLMINSAANGVHFCGYDGNGNVAALVKAVDGTLSAKYEYDPFGKTIRATGVIAKENPFRFSTKRTDNTTDLVLYEARFYNPNTGKWLSRDPIEEQGGLNLCAVEGNDFINGLDPVGLALLTHSTSSAAAKGAVIEGLRPGSEIVSDGWPNIWMSDETSFVPPNDLQLNYDINVEGAKEVPCKVIQEAMNQGKAAASGLSKDNFGSVYGDALWNHINKWIQKQPEGIWKVPTGDLGKAIVDNAKFKGYHYAFKSASIWRNAKPVLKSIRVVKASQANIALGEDPALSVVEQAARAKFTANAVRAVRVGGRVLLVVGIATSAYDVYTADNPGRELAGQAGGWAGAWQLAKYGSKAGAAAGALVPGAGETGTSELVGFIGGGLIGGGVGFWGGHKAGTTVYDGVFTPGFEY